MTASAIREQIALRSHRARHFDPALFGEPAWDVLLDLALARIEGREVCFTSACIASGVPATTARRYIHELAAQGLVNRRSHPTDRRSVFVDITDEGFARVSAALSMTALARVA